MLAGKLEIKENLKVCKIPDKKNEYCLANKYCRDKDTDKKDFVSDHDILFYVNRDDPRGPIPDKPDRDAQYKNWEKGVENWYEKQKGVVVADVPKDECQADDFSSYQPKVSLTTPGSVSSSSLSLSISADAPYGVDKATYSVDGSEVGVSSDKPYSYNYTIPDSKNHSTIKVEVELRDENGNKATDSKNVEVSF